MLKVNNQYTIVNIDYRSWKQTCILVRQHENADWEAYRLINKNNSNHDKILNEILDELDKFDYEEVD